MANTVAELEAHGVTLVMPPTVRGAERILLAIFLDPDGFPITIGQPLGSQESA